MTPGPWNRLNWSFPLVMIGGLGGLLLVLLCTSADHPWWALVRLLVAGAGVVALGALLWWLRRRQSKTR